MGAGADRRVCLDLRRFRYSRKSALWITLVFVITGSLWILVTDTLLYRMVAPVAPASLIARLETAKGWAFVAVAGVLIYACSSHSLAAVQRSDAMRRAILDNMNDGVFLVGPAGTCIGVNAATARMLNVSNLDDLIGLTAAEASRLFRLCTPHGNLIPPEQYASVRALRGEIVNTYVGIVHPPEQPPLAVSITAAPVRATPDGPVELSVTIIRDVSAMYRLDRMRDDFFAGAAHALETPVTTIGLQAQLLSTRDESPALQRSVAIIQRQCSRIEWLVRNLLVAARGRDGSLTFHMEPVNLKTLALETARDLGVREPGLVLELQIDGSPRVFADRERLGLALSNLIVHGYSSPNAGDQVRLTVATRGSQVRVTVAQQGGDQDHAPLANGELRARFDRIEDGGLELFVCEQIVEAHGSRLERDPGGPSRSRTWFELPRLTVAPEASA